MTITQLHKRRICGLYARGYPVDSVSRLLSLPRRAVREAVHAAGILRTAAEGQLARAERMRR